MISCQMQLVSASCSGPEASLGPRIDDGEAIGADHDQNCRSNCPCCAARFRDEVSRRSGHFRDERAPHNFAVASGDQSGRPGQSGTCIRQFRISVMLNATRTRRMARSSITSGRPVGCLRVVSPRSGCAASSGPSDLPDLGMMVHSSAAEPQYENSEARSATPGALQNLRHPGWGSDHRDGGESLATSMIALRWPNGRTGPSQVAMAVSHQLAAQQRGSLIRPGSRLASGFGSS